MPTSRHELIKTRLAWVRGELDGAIGRLTPEMLGWRPAEGMRSVAGQLLEIIEVEIPLVPWLTDGHLPSDAEFGQALGRLENLDDFRDRLAEVRARTLAYLDMLSDTELAEEAPAEARWFGAVWRDRLPRAEFFLNICDHEYYHVGQLIAYLWSRGDDPYKW